MIDMPRKALAKIVRNSCKIEKKMAGAVGGADKIV
jgi:hypothetical protein